ncbi:PREDICTED: protein asteroid homolog 1-like [Amphimedon queenslandica]|uniref:Asteroid domain-containing protein n=2 Tax=Amphimedon queenslandica TaxID=400682 RepID=A0AAN0IPX3_AMPQE|nr:PREDICTED: protein asteroid homolog 1-like [Amphimedon queenslandica]|eukprot:XP_011406460.1 PREDICTED: protein asteroid homolog 1-like [Amphimedon queenslandica]
MGIRDFQSYMLKSGNLTQIGRGIQGPLLIDGMAACYRLYRELDWKNGGQYKELEHKCIDFVTNLRKSNIEPIFVFDGVDYKGEKKQTLVRRRMTVDKISSYLLTDCISDCSCIPIFARIVMSEVLRQMKVPFIVADGDADSLTASIANYYKCPVLSNDSDFFLYNVEGGYIPFQSFDCTKCCITGNIYNWTDFASIFRNPDIVYLIPALASNDFISESVEHDVMAVINKGSSSSIFATRGRFGRARRTSGSSNRIFDVVDYIRSSSSVEEFFLSCSFKAA